jgi:hypothetical protein
VADKAEAWRLEQVMALGYALEDATAIAGDRSIDLHRFLTLAAAAIEKHGPARGRELALRIFT